MLSTALIPLATGCRYLAHGRELVFMACRPACAVVPWAACPRSASPLPNTSMGPIHLRSKRATIVRAESHPSFDLCDVSVKDPTQPFVGIPGVLRLRYPVPGTVPVSAEQRAMVKG